MRFLYGFNPPIHEALGYGKSVHDCMAEVHKRAMAGDVADPAERRRSLTSTSMSRSLIRNFGTFCGGRLSKR